MPANERDSESDAFGGDAGWSDESAEFLRDVDRAAERINAIFTTDRRFAVHEAGHAIVAIELGLPVHSVSIEPDGTGSVARAEIGQTLDLRKFVTINLAGWLAESIDNGRQPLPDGRASAAHDDARIENELLGAFLSVKDPDTFRQECSDHADRILMGRWPQVDILAAALLAERVLGGERVRDLLAWDEVIDPIA